MVFRFVHTADVHLDSPLRSLALRDPEIAEMIGNATRQAFERTVELCLVERVDALMIAGDLFDGNLRSMKTAIFFSGQMRRLVDAGIRVFIVRGNHDAESVVTKNLFLPAGVHVFAGRAQAVPIEGRDIAVHGISFAQRKAPESLVPKFKAPVPGAVNIGLLHTSLGGADGHDDYSPCSVADLTAHGFNYWGLGHVHKRQVHAEGHCVVVMPGIPQGRDINEAGPKSVTLVTVSDGGDISLEERVTSIAQFERVNVDVTDAAEWEDVLARLERALRATREATESDHLVARIQFLGRTSLALRLRRDADLLLDDARQVAGACSRTSIEKLEVDCHPPETPPELAGYDPVLELGDLIANEVKDSDAFRATARDIVLELQSQLPASIRDFLGDSEQAIEEMVGRMISEGGDEVLARLKTRGEAS